ELLRDNALLESLRAAADGPQAAVHRGLALVWERGTFLRLILEVSGGSQELYFLNTERDRRTVAQIKRGELDLGQLGVAADEDTLAPTPNIFSLYEENIGMVTPLVADELKEAEKTYPPGWIEGAFREAVDLNRRNWRYIARILERWAREGKDGKYRGDTKEDIQPSKYLQGKYARIVQH
ncbi:MAG: DnaD domain protein, partial [Dehalococcoidia bacterium]|nr:DnaD domain protein [Dehalococcoidia bacterium]